MAPTVPVKVSTYARPTSPPYIPPYVWNALKGSKRDVIVIGMAACAGCVLGLSGLLLYVRLRRRVNRDVLALKTELATLREKISARNHHQEDYVVDSVIGLLKNSSNSDSNSLVDSERIENNAEVFFDTFEKVPDLPEDPFLKDLFERVDYLLINNCDENRIKSYTLLNEAFPKYQNNWDFLWRYSRSTFLYAQSFLGQNDDQRLHYFKEAKKLAYAAYKLNKNDAEIHKWCATTRGVLTDYVGIKQKIKDGALIKWHLEKALLLQPADFILHHALGRWCYTVASLTWIERKLAKTFFNFEVPTLEEALNEFLKVDKNFPAADKLRPSWHENWLYIIKCYLALRQYDNAQLWYKRAIGLAPTCVDDEGAKKDIEKLSSNFKE